MRLEQAQRAIAQDLALCGVESPSADARILLCAALGIEHLDLLRDSARSIGEAAAALETFVARRREGEPVSRIIGERDFWCSRFKINLAVFDPRPATETLVEAVLEHAALFPRETWRILDLGTGSGAVLCALLRSLPGSFGIGVDISAQACMVARGNLMRLGLSQRGLTLCGDWAKALRGQFDVIVSNPPYIARGEFGLLPVEVREHDPHLALDGGNDGLAAYREIIPALDRLLAPGGFVAFEIGDGQRFAVEFLLRDTLRAAADAKLDLDGRWRVVMARSRPSAVA
ncbi:MAG: peptide chain release factor N(5)-glutamine methyltransferase [Methylocapsa sp.]|nr:peptide chain release factor N(5)-glutamine methyltransferase [Methylocapsa sp.]